MLKRILCIVLVFSLLVSFSACGKKEGVNEEPTTREFTDDLDTTVSLSAKITKVAVTGPLAQYYVIPVAAEELVALSTKLSDTAAKYYPSSLSSLETIGQIYGGKGTLDKEKMLALAPDVVIDIGEAKDNIKTDFENLSKELNIPFVHIEATALTSSKVFERLGELLGKEEQTKLLSDFLDETLAKVNTIMDKVNKANARKSIVYAVSDTGLNVLAKGSYHVASMDLVADNAAVVEKAVGSGAGNEISLEQMYIWNPDVLLIKSESLYNHILQGSTFKSLDAVENNHYYLVPNAPFEWISTPPNFIHILGLSWLTTVLYPEYSDIDIEKTAIDFFRTFYNYELTSETFLQIIE